MTQKKASKNSTGIQGDVRLVMSEPNEPVEGQKAVLFPNVSIFDGTSETLKKEMHVLVVDNKITKISKEPIKAEPGTTVLKTTPGQVLMPGLIDAHYHLNASRISQANLMGQHESYMYAMTIAECENNLMQGVTTVRDMAGPLYGIQKAIDEDDLKGPRIYVCGPMISQIGGHGDFRSKGQLANDKVAMSGTTAVTTGADGVMAEAREAMRLGASFIKIAISGGYASPTDPILGCQFSLAEMEAAVEVATDYGTYVAAHGYSVEAVNRALDAGVMSIEHGHLIDEATMERMAKMGAWLSTQPFTDRSHPWFSDIQNEKMSQVADGCDLLFETAKKIPELNVAWGSDLFFSRDETDQHVAEQLCNRMQRWYTPAQALKLATGNAGRCCKLAGRCDPYPGKLGVIEEDAYADMLLVQGNPLEKLEVIGDRDNLKIIMKDGKIYKNTL